MPVTRSFDVFFDLCLNKRLSEPSGGWWFETPSRSLWRHYNESLHCFFSYTNSQMKCLSINSHNLFEMPLKWFVNLYVRPNFYVRLQRFSIQVVPLKIGSKGAYLWSASFRITLAKYGSFLSINMSTNFNVLFNTIGLSFQVYCDGNIKRGTNMNCIHVP